MGKRELVALLNLSSWCLVMVERLFLAVPRGCLRFVIVVYPDHTNLLFLFIPTSISTELTADDTALLVRVISLQPIRRYILTMLKTALETNY